MTTAKESSDELNPLIPVPASEIPPAKRRTAGDYFALAIATCGVGYFPIAPGTLGSLVGAAVYLSAWDRIYDLLEASAVRRQLGPTYIFAPLLASMLLVIVLVTMIGTWAATRVERLKQKKDPSIVVIDEVAGQMIALLSVQFWSPSWWSIVSAFILFRAFDIWKPYPIRRLEALESGLGIMLDDVAAGLYAAVANTILIAVVGIFFLR